MDSVEDGAHFIDPIDETTEEVKSNSTDISTLKNIPIPDKCEDRQMHDKIKTIDRNKAAVETKPDKAKRMEQPEKSICDVLIEGSNIDIIISKTALEYSKINNDTMNTKKSWERENMKIKIFDDKSVASTSKSKED